VSSGLYNRISSESGGIGRRTRLRILLSLTSNCHSKFKNINVYADCKQDRFRSEVDGNPDRLYKSSTFYDIVFVP
jgi:hypothetical protein